MKRKKKPLKTITLPYTVVKQGGKRLLLASMPASVLVKISYVAVRRQDEEEELEALRILPSTAVTSRPASS
jgi:hypothetical protein